MKSLPEVIQDILKENPQIKYITAFQSNGRGEAKCPPDPKYPKGKVVDFANARIGCAYDIPYPAPECGSFYTECLLCGSNAIITAAGRPDDPISVILPCKNKDKKSCSPEKNLKS